MIQPAQPRHAGPERRQRRSADPTVAAVLFLQAVASRGRHASVALADHDGLLLAGAGVLDAEAVAAVAPLVDQGHSAADGLLGLVTRGAPLHVWPLDLAGARCYLAAVGGLEAPPADAEPTLNRIFA